MFAAKFWGKEKIDALERQIAVYGATDSLKQLTIKYSLLYNIRCQYTAYLADKTNPVSGVDEQCAVQEFALSLSGTDVTLRWSVLAQDQVLECSIWRSDDPSTGFTRIGTAAANAATFTDGRTSSRAAYYRLEIVTRSGRRFTSATLSTTGSMTPVRFELFSNYPNPFNPSTTVRFAVASAQMVRMTMYDLLGREVATLVNERLQPGMYTRVWDARNVPSGVYICMLRAGAFTASQKMILQK
jgi:hypothetical protein